MPSAEVAKLAQAIESFEARLPRDLPDGVMESLSEVKEQLAGYEPDRGNSPGQRQAAEVQGTDGTGVSFRKAARGVDKPSPGQREAEGVSVEIEKAAASIAERVKRDQGNPQQDQGAAP